MNYQAVLFDLDGVIINSEPLHLAAFQATLGRHGYRLKADEYDRYFAGKTDEVGFQQYLAPTNNAELIARMLEEKARIYTELLAGHLVAYPEALELIHQLVVQKVPLGLVTGSRRTEVLQIFQALSLTGCFSVVVTAEDIHHSKPDPEGCLKAAAKLSVHPRDCLVIEDTPSGVEAAVAAGMRCLAVTTTHSSQELIAATRVVDVLRLVDLDLP